MYGGSSGEGSMISRQNSRTSADFDDFRGQIFTCVAVYKVCYYLKCYCDRLQLERSTLQ